MSPKPETTKRAKGLRQSQTAAEGILWSLLRSGQLCGLNFRRQHSIGPFFADFACLSQRLVIELDGEYHDQIQDHDLRRERFLQGQRWKVMRFANADVMKDAEAVLRAIARELGLPYEFRKRTPERSGMMSRHAPNNVQCSTSGAARSSLGPHPAATASDLPGGEVK